MAKLSAHGTEIGRIHYTTQSVAYFDDGHILRNYGAGWKLYKRVKDGIAPAIAYANAKARHEALLAERPCLAAYARELRTIACASKRGRLHTAVSMMPGDPDGVWSTVCDDTFDAIEADVDDIVKLCRLYQAAEREQKEMKCAC